MTTTATSLTTPMKALESWVPVAWLKTNVYAYPALEVVHIVSIAMLFGTLWIVDVRLLGRLRQFDANALAKAVLPWTITGFLFALLSGLTMLITRVSDLIANPAFIVKMCLLFAAGINAAALHARGALDSTSMLTRAQALLSIFIWLAVITCGRWIAYV
jgi:uncharacterized membrane protein